VACEAVQSGRILPVISVKYDNCNEGIYVSRDFYLIN
jgi:hypothetical protein